MRMQGLLTCKKGLSRNYFAFGYSIKAMLRHFFAHIGFQRRDPAA